MSHSKSEASVAMGPIHSVFSNHSFRITLEVVTLRFLGNGQLRFSVL
jgi:hypothetical protein